MQLDKIHAKTYNLQKITAKMKLFLPVIVLHWFQTQIQFLNKTILNRPWCILYELGLAWSNCNRLLAEGCATLARLQPTTTSGVVFWVALYIL